MKLAIPLTPPSLDEALAFVDQLRNRPDCADRAPLAEAQWEQAVTAAASKRDRDGLATLLRAQLVPALGLALLGLARIVERAEAGVQAPTESQNYGGGEFVQLVETVQRRVMWAGQATWAAELRSGLLPGHAGPSRDRPEALQGVKAKMTAYLQMQLDDGDVLEAIADDVGLALRQLCGPVRAAVEVIDADELDDLLAYPLQQQLFATFHAISAAHLYLATVSMVETAVERTQVR